MVCGWLCALSVHKSYIVAIVIVTTHTAEVYIAFAA